MISTYIFYIQYLHLKNSIWALILPGMLSVFNLLIMRSFISSIPTSLIESAKLDGAGEFTIFVKIILPLSKAGLATIGLFMALYYWNDWYNAMLYMIDTDNYNTSSMWAVRNSDYMKNSEGTPENWDAMKAAWDAQIDDNKGAQKYRSFVLDTSAIETEWTACVNVHQQYWWPLELGYTNAEAGLAEYQKMMEAAGIDKVIEEIQRQVDEYVASLNG